MDKCKCWRIAYEPVQGPIPHTTTQYCIGTRECESCYCDGDETRCTFYPKKREQAIKLINRSNRMNDLIEAAIKDGITVECSFSGYNIYYSFRKGQYVQEFYITQDAPENAQIYYALEAIQRLLMYPYKKFEEESYGRS